MINNRNTYILVIIYHYKLLNLIIKGCDLKWRKNILKNIGNVVNYVGKVLNKISIPSRETQNHHIANFLGVNGYEKPEDNLRTVEDINDAYIKKQEILNQGEDSDNKTNIANNPNILREHILTTIQPLSKYKKLQESYEKEDIDPGKNLIENNYLIK